MRAAASRIFCTAGSNRPIRMAMMAMTTSNSISVNADRARPPRRGRNDIAKLLDGKKAILYRTLPLR
jgi:hypothetical protein